MIKAKRIAATVAAVMMLLCGLSINAAAVEGFDENGCLVFATEPGGTSDYVSYYKGDEEQPHDAMKWVDGGVRGKALSLNGKNETLRIGYYQLRMAQMTFSTWINFRGALDATKPATAYNQRLFTIESGENCYFTVSPHVKNPDVKKTDGYLNGVYMEYYRGDEEDNYSMKSFNSAIENRSHFGLPRNEWHHMAVTVDNMSVKLYIDGNMVQEELFLMPIVQMSADSMIIGGGLWNDPLLNALVDDMMLFDKALTEQQIAALMQTGDVAKLEKPAAATTTETMYHPTAVVTTTEATVPTEHPADKPYAPFGLPLWGFGVCVGLVGALIVVTVIVNLYEASHREKPSKDPIDTEDEVAAPTMSIKQAALQKRREERERFLTQEQQEKERGDQVTQEKEGE